MGDFREVGGFVGLFGFGWVRYLCRTRSWNRNMKIEIEISDCGI